MAERDDIRIDPRSLGSGARDQVLMILGRLQHSAEAGAVDRSRMDKKIDDLGGMALTLTNELRIYVERDNAAHEKLNAQLTILQTMLHGDPNTDGLIRRLAKVEARQDRNRNFMLGAVSAATAIASVVSAMLNVLAKKIGWS